MPKSLHVFLWLGFIETLCAVIWLFQQSRSLSWFCSSKVGVRGCGGRGVGGRQTEGILYCQKRCVWFILDGFFFDKDFAQQKKSVFVLKVSQLAMKTAEANGPEWELCFLVRLVLFRLFGLFIAALTATFKGKTLRRCKTLFQARSRLCFCCPAWGCRRLRGRMGVWRGSTSWAKTTIQTHGFRQFRPASHSPVVRTTQTKRNHLSCSHNWSKGERIKAQKYIPGRNRWSPTKKPTIHCKFPSHSY